MPEVKSTALVVNPPDFAEMLLVLRGTAPLVVNRFAAKAAMMAAMAEGATAKSRKKREPRDFAANYEAAKHRAAPRFGGWEGVHAAAFRNALISACRTVGVVMTRAKLAVFVIADGYSDDGTPLVRLYGESIMATHHARNDDGSVDVRARPMYHDWKVQLRLRFDRGMIKEADVANLVMRAGLQVGICDGRPDSKNSAGQGWGLFEIEAPE